MKSLSYNKLASLLAGVTFLLSACGGSPDGANGTPLSGGNSAGAAVFNVSTIAGIGAQGYANGPGLSAMFDYPTAVAVDSAGNVYVSDTSNQVIRKISADGMVSTFAGQVGQAGYQDGPASTAMFFEPVGLVVDRSGNLFVADTGNLRIRKITPTGEVSTYAGSGTSSPDPAVYQDGPALQTAFAGPQGVTLDAAGNLYVADTVGPMIRKISPAGQVTTVAGVYRVGGGADCTMGSCATFTSPNAMAFDRGGNLYVTDSGNQRIRKITPAGVVSTFAGSGIPGFADGAGVDARFDSPFGIVVDSKDNLYVSDQNNRVIRKITPDGLVSTVAGQPGIAGNTQGTGKNATFYLPSGMAIDKDDNLYVADYSNHSVRKLVLK
jgi:sugar lactone lactonase YvrE